MVLESWGKVSESNRVYGEQTHAGAPCASYTMVAFTSVFGNKNTLRAAQSLLSIFCLVAAEKTFYMQKNQVVVQARTGRYL